MLKKHRFAQTLARTSALVLATMIAMLAASPVEAFTRQGEPAKEQAQRGQVSP